MATYNNLADFSSEGFNIGQNAKVMSYLHGLSDFWVYMFDDASKINMLMEAHAITASDIYNKFLQMTSVISLEGISTLTNSQIKLLLISEDDAVEGKVETYSFPEGTDLKYARCLVNRAFLPTATLENEADYYIDEALGQISFAQPLSGLGFPFRTLSSGKKEYALWAIDAKVDDQLIYDYYAKLINIDPTSSSDLFKDFVYGMYYLFVQGPHLDTVKKGLNIALGIPLARDTESVLEVRKYLNSDQWLVITDLNSYLIPYGLEPTVLVDDVLVSGQELASWIEVKDWENDGEWWINFMLPAHLMPHIPPSIPGGGGVNADAVPDRYMTPGSYADWLMRNYLKTHTFLVNVKTVNFKNIQTFEQMSQIIRQVKPSYATPIYVWTVPTNEEIIDFKEEAIKLVLDRSRCECIAESIGRFRRDSTLPLDRDCPRYTRMSAPSRLNYTLGLDPDTQIASRPINNGFINGYIAPNRVYGTLSSLDEAWLRALRTRSQDQYMPNRSFLDYYRYITAPGDGVTGVGVRTLTKAAPGMRMVYLYTTTREDLEDKFSSVYKTVPDDYYFTLFEPEYVTDLINEHLIDGSELLSHLPVLTANFNYYFTPGSSGRFLTPMFGGDSFNTYKPNVSDLRDTDYLAFTDIGDNCFGVFWMTSNFEAQTPAYWGHDEADSITMNFTAPINRGGAALGSPFYMTRGTGVTLSYNKVTAINDETTNEALGDATNLSITYSDTRNAPFTVDRSGNYLTVYRTLT